VGQGGKLLGCAPASSKTSRKKKMEAYRIDRFGSIDGICFLLLLPSPAAGTQKRMNQGSTVNRLS
jgi:hypothetical protein